MKQTMCKENISVDNLYTLVKTNLDKFKVLFDDFTCRTIRLQTNGIPNVMQQFDQLKSSDDQIHRVLSSYLMFNSSILKTNVNIKGKSAIGYSLDPKVFLQKSKFPEIPYSILMFIGKEFRGFCKLIYIYVN